MFGLLVRILISCVNLLAVLDLDPGPVERLHGSGWLHCWFPGRFVDHETSTWRRRWWGS